jgi:hypothetical protein
VEDDTDQWLFLIQQTVLWEVEDMRYSRTVSVVLLLLVIAALSVALTACDDPREEGREVGKAVKEAQEDAEEFGEGVREGCNGAVLRDDGAGGSVAFPTRPRAALLGDGGLIVGLVALAHGRRKNGPG